jgi:hypothetical protein
VSRSLLHALAGPSSVTSCEGDGCTFRGAYTLAGGTPAQQAAAQACLVAAAVAADPGNTPDTRGVRRWLAGFRPANAPVAPNAQTTANATIALANCPAAGGAVSITFDYSCAPVDPLLAHARDCDLEDADCDCGCEGGYYGLACCFEDGHCEVLLPEDCELFGGEIYGTQSCDPDLCLPGQACCFGPDCVLLMAPDCVAQGGVVYPDLTCDPNPCPQPPEYACCFEDGSCLVLTEEECVAQGGVVYAVEDCDPNPCPPPEYACCLPLDENCYMLTEEACLAVGGTWYAEQACSDAGGTFDCPLWRVCCINGECHIATEIGCGDWGGVWHPEWTTCEPENPCEIPVPVSPGTWGAIKSVYR